MSKCSEWIEDILGAVKQSQNTETIQMIECCGKGCANRKNAKEGIRQMKDAASDCKTQADYVPFLNKAMPIEVMETKDGILLHLGKEKCSCPMANEITQNADMLCECTRGHEKAVWSTFFGKPVEVEIVESYLRGGKDCVIKILI